MKKHLNVLDNLFKFEDNLKNWIGIERKKWYSILFLVGVSFGMLFNRLMGNEIGFKMGLSFGLVLMVTEFFVGGSGID